MPAALIQLNFESPNDWIDKKNYSIDKNPTSIIASSEVRERIQIEIDNNSRFGKWEQIKKFEITPDIWCIEGGHLILI